MATSSDLLLGIDWGTSNRRAYLIDRAGVAWRVAGSTCR